MHSYLVALLFRRQTTLLTPSYDEYPELGRPARNSGSFFRKRETRRLKEETYFRKGVIQKKDTRVYIIQRFIIISILKRLL